MDAERFDALTLETDGHRAAPGVVGAGLQGLSKAQRKAVAKVHAKTLRDKKHRHQRKRIKAFPSNVGKAWYGKRVQERFGSVSHALVIRDLKHAAPAESKVGEFVKWKRKKLGLSQKGLADEATRIGREVIGRHRGGIFVDSNYIALVEQGRIKLPRRQYLIQIAAALDVDPSELLAAAGYLSKTPNPFDEGIEQDKHKAFEIIRNDRDGELTKKMLSIASVD